MPTQTDQPMVFNSPVFKRPVNSQTVSQIFDILGNNQITYATVMAVLQSANLDEWMLASRNYGKYLDSTIGKGIDPDLIPSVQNQKKAQQRSLAQATWTANMTKIFNMLELMQNDTVNAIKKAKFPHYYSTDPTKKLIGTEEFLSASHLPIKYITVELLDNSFNADRIDYVCSLLERAGLCKREFKLEDWKKLCEFGLRVYDFLKITDQRKFLRFLDLLIKVVKIQLNSTLANEGMIVPSVFGLANTVAINIAEVEHSRHNLDEDLLEHFS